MISNVLGAGRIGSARRVLRTSIALNAVALVPVSLAPTMLGLAGSVYFVGAFALGLGLLWLTVQFGMRRTLRAARWLFVGSILYLPALWMLLIANRI